MNGSGHDLEYAFRGVPHPPPKKVPNLWTMWKTQESSTLRLWITFAGSLFASYGLCYNRLRSLKDTLALVERKTAGGGHGLFASSYDHLVWCSVLSTAPTTFRVVT